MRASTIPLIALLALTACDRGAPAAAEPAAPAVDLSAPLPGDSVYQLDMALVSQQGESTTLSRHRGHPTVVSMFYASCPAACPMLISDIKAIRDELPPSEQDELRVIMVSFDPEADTPEALARLGTDHGLDPDRWTLAQAQDPADVRALAAVLGISYRRLDNGHYNHSAVITLLDRQGSPLARIDGLNKPADPIILALGD